MSALTIQPSPPPSPIEEDISRASGVYAHLEEGASSVTLTGLTERQKQKRRAEEPFDDDEDDSSSSEEGEVLNRKESYPPTNDEEAESRRIQENLRRWEIAERERRKAARDSSSTVTSSSLVGDVTRRASLLWPGRRRSRQATQGVGTHHIIPSSEEGVALEEIENDTPTPNMLQAEHEGNPFTTPMASTTSLNTPEDSAIMMEASESGAVEEEPPDTLPAQRGVGRRKTRSGFQAPPPPQPLDLPRPCTPPPRTGSPHTDRAPEPIAPPVVGESVLEEDVPDKRWWTDWLCGCREHGDNQAGRTNPFE